MFKEDECTCRHSAKRFNTFIAIETFWWNKLKSLPLFKDMNRRENQIEEHQQKTPDIKTFFAFVILYTMMIVFFNK